MKTIDWATAPEGATHKDINYPLWYKFDFQNDTAAYFDPHSHVWVRSGKASDYNDGSMDDMVARPDEADQREQTRQEIIDLAAKKCGLFSDEIRQLATVLAAEGYRKFEIVEGDV